MFFKTFLEQFGDKRIKIFVDMDGVVADYNVGVPYDYHLKRPLFDSIKKLEEISKMPNVELYILSATRLNEGYEKKQGWLDKYLPFMKKENRFILSREANNMEKSSVLKNNFFKELERDGSIIIMVDDDPTILHEIKDANEDVIPLKDTVLVD
jgi:5'(3')-deoxyribonucleotidase